MLVAEVTITLKEGVADPEGRNTHKTLGLLGFSEVVEVSSAQRFSITLDTDDTDKAQQMADGMCRRLLANPVIQEYTIDIHGAST